MGLTLHSLKELLRHRDELMPVFLGSFDGVDDLPKRSYPHCYWWINKQLSCAVLSWNGPLLDETILRIAAHFKFELSEKEVESIRKEHIATVTPYANSFIESCMCDLSK